MNTLASILFFVFVFNSYWIFSQNSIGPNEDLKSKKARKFSNQDSKRGNSDTISVLSASVVDGDTLPMVFLPMFGFEERRFASDFEKRKYYRLVANVKKVYPYAKLAGEKLREYEAEVARMERKRDQKKFIKGVEQSLKDEFGDELKELTITQGKILIRLVDRETGECSYELVKELRGVISAFFWQTLAKLFGHDLKVKYDPLNNEEDRMIEEIIMKIEKGEI